MVGLGSAIVGLEVLGRAKSRVRNPNSNKRAVDDRYEEILDEAHRAFNPLNNLGRNIEGGDSPLPFGGFAALEFLEVGIRNGDIEEDLQKKVFEAHIPFHIGSGYIGPIEYYFALEKFEKSKSPLRTFRTERPYLRLRRAREQLRDFYEPANFTPDSKEAAGLARNIKVID